MFEPLNSLFCNYNFTKPNKYRIGVFARTAAKLMIILSKLFLIFSWGRF